MFQCGGCGTKFASKRNLAKHSHKCSSKSGFGIFSFIWINYFLFLSDAVSYEAPEASQPKRAKFDTALKMKKVIEEPMAQNKPTVGHGVAILCACGKLLVATGAPLSPSPHV